MALLALAVPVAGVGLQTPSAAAATSAVAEDSAPPTPAPSSADKAARLAVETGQPVEIIDRREENAETFANPDGTTTRRQYAAPIWSRYQGVWKKADPSMVQHPDGTVGPASPVFGMAFSGGGDTALATMTKDDKQLSLSWPAALPQPVLDGNAAVYKSVLPGVDLKIVAEVDGFAQNLIINTPQAAANPAVQNIELGITALGVTLDDDAADNLTATDAEGNVVFSAPHPKMWEQPDVTTEAKDRAASTATDLSDQPSSAPVGVEISDNTLTLTPDPTLLATADQFPLVVDPPFSGGTREKWAVVYSATPNADYPNGSGWNSSTPSDEPRVGFNGTGRTRSFYAMNTDGLAGADILNATFAVVETHSWGCDPSLAGATELWSTGGIGTTPTWNSQPGWADKLDSDSYAHSNPTYCPGKLGHDYHSTALTNYVQRAADNRWGTLVFGLRADASHEGDHDSFKRFTNNPALEVTYNYKPTVADHDAYEGTWSPGSDGNKPVACSGLIGNSGIALTAKLTDKDGGKVTGEFQVTNSAGSTIASLTDQVSTGQTASVTVRAGKLPNGSYTWKVRAKDDENTTSPYTTACRFTVDRIGPEQTVTVTNTDGTPADEPTDTYRARTPVQLQVSNTATDLAGFCFSTDLYLSISSTRCSNGTWVSVSAGQHSARITINPSGTPQSTLHVLAFDKAGNHSPYDNASGAVTLSTTPADFVYPPGKTPGTGLAHTDLPGDVTGDGYTDMVAIDNAGKLRLYAGNGTGKVSAAETVGTGGWNGALIGHRGDLRGLTSPGAAPDGYEDFVVRLNDNKLYIYGGDGQGRPIYDTRTELVHTNIDTAADWRRIRQIITPGDIDQNTSTGHEAGNDLITIECTTDACTDANLYLYTGNTIAGGGQDQGEPFDLNNRTLIGNGGWRDYTNLAVGDQNNDGVQDLLARKPSTGELFLYPGHLTNGTLSLGPRTLYGTGGWDRRPHLASPGNVQGTVTTGSYSDPDAGTDITYHQFQPTTDETYGDLWATTPADPDYTVNYTDDTGTSQSTTCPTGCLLFYPGGPSTHRTPKLVGLSSWDTVITNIS
ncbi:hypothetical protein [Streptomyces sp. E5N91]|uniref:hypothetical protein n=1 Tax=Streptomyces sp. E5N91 TaxID=1851996 RepID=UPI0012922A76|nr:hypothetical protein [Streptomyces sp. E5N91]